MPRPAAPIVLLHLPTLAGRDVLRSGLMAMHCVPENMPTNMADRLARLASFAPESRVFCVLDVSIAQAAGSDEFQSVANQIPLWLRARTLLTRMANGHVSAADRVWVKALGFADFLPEFDALEPEGNLRLALDAAAQSLALPKLPADDLMRYIRATQMTAKPNAARALIRQHTGLAAEQLHDSLADLLVIADRTYHLKKYAQCFVASEAVQKLALVFKLSPTQAVEVGQALGALGLLFHVEHKHAFTDAELFFRLAHSREADAIDPWQVLDLLQRELVLADRSYLGTVYRQCWVGSEAVDVLSARYALPRHVAHLVLHRLMQFGVFAHVVKKQLFIDGKFFYAFSKPTSN